MAIKKEKYLVGLDIGTHKVCTVIGELNQAGEVEVIGVGLTESHGLRRGVVVNLEAAVNAIRASVEEAELMAGFEIEAAFVGVAGAHIKGINSKGVIPVSGKDRVITRADVNRVLEAAAAVTLPGDRKVLHIISQEFIVDGQEGILEPTGMCGTRLEANVHIVIALTTSINNVVNCVNQAGLEVEGIILEQIAASEAVLSPDERELGVALIDIGGGTTDLAIFRGGSICHSAVLPSAGDHFTRDIAVGIRTNIKEAEKIKREYGCAHPSGVKENETFEVPGVTGRKPRIMSREALVEIIEARAEEIMKLVANEIRRVGYIRSLNSGVVLTGGGALLSGIVEVGEEVFQLPVRLGIPEGVSGLIDVVRSPVYSTAVGLLIYGKERREGKGEVSFAPRGWGRLISRLKKLFSEI
jgi:cell division protein FtsA